MRFDSLDFLKKEESRARSKSHFQEIEARWMEALQKVPHEFEQEYLVHYNRFRLRNLPVLKKKRPALLIGYINDHHFPNFHTRDLLKIADIISLSTSEDADPSIDRLVYFPAKDNFQTIRKRFPTGFKPDLYWDMQAAHGHIHPIGLSSNPFPSVASICHIQHGAAVKTMTEMFDYVIPVGRGFSPSLSYGKAKVINLPFGANWASFHSSFQDKVSLDTQRDIDVSVTFSTSPNPVYHGLRNEIIKIVEQLKLKWKDRYKVVIKASLTKPEYQKLLTRSKISINVVGMNGPFNYRSCEIINSGALLLQTNIKTGPTQPPIKEYLEEDIHFSGFMTDNLEEKILLFLENSALRNEIVKRATSFLQSELSYEKIFLHLLSEIKHFKKNEDRKVLQLNQDRFYLGTFLWQQQQDQNIQQLGAAFAGQSLMEENDFPKLVSNLLAILPELLSSMGIDYLRNCLSRHSTALANSLDPKNMKQIAVQLFSVQMDHISFCYNFLALSVEFNWSPNEVLAPIAKQAFTEKDWPQFNSDWILRPVQCPSHFEQNNFKQINYEKFLLPLARADSKAKEWIIYRDYLFSLMGIA